MGSSKVIQGIRHALIQRIKHSDSKDQAQEFKGSSTVIQRIKHSDPKDQAQWSKGSSTVAKGSSTVIQRIKHSDPRGSRTVIHRLKLSGTVIKRIKNSVQKDQTQWTQRIKHNDPKVEALTWICIGIMPISSYKLNLKHLIFSSKF